MGKTCTNCLCSNLSRLIHDACYHHGAYWAHWRRPGCRACFGRRAWCTHWSAKNGRICTLWRGASRSNNVRNTSSLRETTFTKSVGYMHRASVLQTFCSYSWLGLIRTLAIMNYMTCNFAHRSLPKWLVLFHMHFIYKDVLFIIWILCTYIFGNFKTDHWTCNIILTLGYFNY